MAALTACSTAHINQELKPGIHYKRDMILEVDGFQGEGVLVIPLKEIHKFHVEARGELDLFTMTTCHREWTKEKAWNVKRKSGLFGWGRKIVKNEVNFDLSLNQLEKSDFCLIELGGYERDKGRHSWAIIDVRSEMTTLPATVNCNGSQYQSEGVTVCQSRAELIQSISFAVEVLTSPDKGCDLPSERGMIFEFPIKKGKCSYAFIETKAPHREHRMTTFGYEKILIRED